MFSSYKKNCVCGIYNKRERENILSLKRFKRLKRKGRRHKID